MRASAGVKLTAFILAASLNGATIHPQSVSSPRTPVMATSVAGSDIGDRVNHALKSCALQCTVYIPAGNYSFGTPIHLELNPFGKYKLSGDPGAVVTYTGSGDAISTPVNNLQGSSQLLIEGFQLRGNPHATAGIHPCRPTALPSAIWPSPVSPGVMESGRGDEQFEHLRQPDFQQQKWYPPDSLVVRRSAASVWRVGKWLSVCSQCPARYIQPDYGQFTMGSF